MDRLDVVISSSSLLVGFLLTITQQHDINDCPGHLCAFHMFAVLLAVITWLAILVSSLVLKMQTDDHTGITKLNNVLLYVGFGIMFLIMNTGLWRFVNEPDSDPAYLPWQYTAGVFTTGLTLVMVVMVCVNTWKHCIV